MLVRHAIDIKAKKGIRIATDETEARNKCVILRNTIKDSTAGRKKPRYLRRRAIASLVTSDRSKV